MKPGSASQTAARIVRLSNAVGAAITAIAGSNIDPATTITNANLR